MNEEAIQSLDADAKGSKVIVVAPIKDEAQVSKSKKEGNEKAIYIINIAGSYIIRDTEDDSDKSYIKELFPKEKLRDVVMSEDESSATISITDDVIDSINKMFGESTKELKLQYQENVVGDMKTLREVFGVKGIYHRLSKVTSKKNVIGKNVDEITDKVVKLKM